MKLNVGASPIWVAEKWHTLDHKVRKDDKYSLVGTASNIPLEKNPMAFLRYIQGQMLTKNAKILGRD